MTIYLDVVLLENLCMNYIILFATGYIMKLKMKQWRILVSSLIGAIYAVVAYLEILPIYSSLWMKLLFSVFMVYMAYNSKKVKQLVKQLVIFYLTSFAFGGCAFALLYFVKPQNILMRNGVYVGTYPIKIALLGGIIGFIITHIAFKIVKTKLKKKDIIYDLTIQIEEKALDIRAMLDTGNLLKDPISGMPVIVVDKQKLKEILPEDILLHIENLLKGKEDNMASYVDTEYITKIRMIPFSSVGKQNGLMVGIKADKVIIKKEDETIERNDAIVGISMQSLSKTNEYQALIGIDLLERSEVHESTANLKI